MKTKKNPILPQAKKTLEMFGENIKLARLRRKLSMEQIAERADISRSTLVKIEKRDDSVSMGSYFQVLFVMSLIGRIKKIFSWHWPSLLEWLVIIFAIAIITYKLSDTTINTSIDNSNSFKPGMSDLHNSPYDKLKKLEKEKESWRRDGN